MTKIPHDDILEGLYKLRIRESEKLKTVLELYDLETHQKKLGPDYHRLKAMVKRSIEQEIRNKNFGARSGNYETNAVVKNQGTKHRKQRSLEDCWQRNANGAVFLKETSAVSGTIWISVQNRHSRIRLRVPKLDLSICISELVPLHFLLRRTRVAEFSTNWQNHSETFTKALVHWPVVFRITRCLVERTRVWSKQPSARFINCWEMRAMIWNVWRHDHAKVSGLVSRHRETLFSLWAAETQTLFSSRDIDSKTSFSFRDAEGESVWKTSTDTQMPPLSSWVTGPGCPGVIFASSLNCRNHGMNLESGNSNSKCRRSLRECFQICSSHKRSKKARLDIFRMYIGPGSDGSSQATCLLKFNPLDTAITFRPEWRSMSKTVFTQNDPFCGWTMVLVSKLHMTSLVSVFFLFSVTRLSLCKFALRRESSMHIFPHERKADSSVSRCSRKYGWTTITHRTGRGKNVLTSCTVERSCIWWLQRLEQLWWQLKHFSQVFDPGKNGSDWRSRNKIEEWICYGWSECRFFRTFLFRKRAKIQFPGLDKVYVTFFWRPRCDDVESFTSTKTSFFSQDCSSDPADWSRKWTHWSSQPLATAVYQASSSCPVAPSWKSPRLVQTVGSRSALLPRGQVGRLRNPSGNTRQQSRSLTLSNRKMRSDLQAADAGRLQHVSERTTNNRRRQRALDCPGRM